MVVMSVVSVVPRVNCLDGRSEYFWETGEDGATCELQRQEQLPQGFGCEARDMFAHEMAVIGNAFQELSSADGELEHRTRRHMLAKLAKGALLALASHDAEDARRARLEVAEAPAVDAPLTEYADVRAAYDILKYERLRGSSGERFRSTEKARHPGSPMEKTRVRGEMHALVGVFLFVSTAVIALILFAPEVIHVLAELSGTGGADDEVDFMEDGPVFPSASSSGIARRAFLRSPSRIGLPKPGF